MEPHRLKSVLLVLGQPLHPITRKFRIERHSTQIRRGDKTAMPEFNLESYLEHSKKVDASDMDFSQAQRYPLSEEEIRCLTYMMDIETHTIVYLKGILSTCAIRDPRTTSFLSCWAYEEFFHGHTLRRFLEAAGVSFSPT